MRMTRKIRRAWFRGKPEWAKCYLLKQRLRNKTKVITYAENKNRLHKYSRYLVAGVMLACLGMGQSVAIASEITASKGVPNNVVKTDNVYNIYNQHVNNGSALNKFDKFNLSTNDIANLQLDKHTVNGVTFAEAQRQINLVNDKVNINGVLNAFKAGKIGGDVYFFSDKGIAIGATGVINVGSLTLGTSTIAGQSIYANWNSFNSMSDISKAKFVAGIGDITIDGTINSIGDVIVGGSNITVSKDADINTGASFTDNGVPSSTLTTADSYRTNFLNLNGVKNAAFATKTSTGDIVLFGNDTIDFKGDAYTSGGNFVASSENIISFTGTETVENGVTVIDKAEVITNGGDVSLSIVKESRGNVSINLNNAVIDAKDAVSNANGNVDILASTITKTVSWAMEGNSAAVNVDNSKIEGDNVNVSAVATITGTIGNDDSVVTYTDAEINNNLEKAVADNETPIWDIVANTGFDVPNLRTLVSATDVEVKSEVNVANSEVKAIGGNKDNNLTDENGNILHGNLNIQSVANSQVITTGLGLINYSVIIGISDVNSGITITNSNLHATDNLKISAKGDNTVNLSYLDLSLLDMFETLRGIPSAAFNWAEINSDVQVNVDNTSTLNVQGNVDVHAESIRNLSSDTVAGGDTDKLGFVASVAIADTNAEANIAGNINADGAITVSALNSVAKDGDFYVADTSVAESMSGDTFLGKPAVNAVKLSLNKVVQSLSEHKGFDITGVPGKAGDWGLNAATAVLVSENNATASVTGRVRDYSGNDGAGSLNVLAENISRTSMGATSYQNELTNVRGDVINSKDVGIALAVNAGLQNNSATAYIGGDIKVDETIDVKAITRIPWQTTFQDYSLSGILTTIFDVITDPNLNLGSLTDSWTQASGTTNKVGAAGSVGVMEYSDNAEAYIAKNATVVAGGNLDIEARTDATTVNFSGNVTSPIKMVPIAFWEGKKNLFKPDLWGASGKYVALGGSALAVRQKNVAKAYIADSDVETINGTDVIKGSVTAKNVDIDAQNSSVNVGVLASGGTSETVAIDGTVGVFRIENEIDAHIGQANVNASATVDGGNITVDALDESHNINLAGVVASGDTAASIGATIAYNHIDRDTLAYINGNVTADNGITISAHNDGLIVATSVAGSVTYNSPLKNVVNAGGSTGTHAHKEVTMPDGTTGIEMDVIVSEDNIVDLAGGLLNVGGSNIFDETVEIDDGIEVINDIGGNAQGANVAAAKTGFAVSANVAVNKIYDDANAYIASTTNVKSSSVDTDERKVNKSLTPNVNAKYLRVSSLNDSEFVAANATASINTTAGKASTGVAGSFMYNSITSGNNAYIKDATVTVSGNDEENVDEALTISAQNLEKIINVSLSGNVAPKGNGVVGQISVNSIANTTNAYLHNSNVSANEKTTVRANDEADIQSYTGAMSVTGGAVGFGAAIGVQDIGTNTTAYITDTQLVGSAVDTKGGNVDVLADENSNITSIVATAGIGINTAMAATFSVSANDVDTVTKAYIDNDENIKAAAINVAARNLANSTIGVGNIGVSKNAVGITSAIGLSNNLVEAYIKGDDNGDNVENTIEANSIIVNASNVYNGAANNSDEDTTAKTVAIGGAVGTGMVAGAGSVTVNGIINTTTAHIDKGKYAVDGNIDVNAQSTAKIFGLAGGVSIAKGVGIGAAVDTELLNITTTAYIDDNVSITKAKDITVNANSIEEITSVAVIAGGGSYFAGAASANAHDIDVNTTAYIGSDGAYETKKTVLSNVGDISVKASDDVDLKSNAGGAAVEIGSGGVAGSLSAAVEVLDKNVKASIGKVTIAGESLNVSAANTGKLLTTANGVALAISTYGAGFTGNASESIVNYNTDVHIANGSNITLADDLYVDADSRFTHIGEATGIAGSTLASAGLSNDTTVFNAKTNAYIGDSAVIVVNNETKNEYVDSEKVWSGVSVTADSDVDITSAVVTGGASGIVAVNGGVGVNVIDTSTKAYIGASAQVTANGTADDGGVKVATTDNTKISGGSGGAAIAVVGTGGAVNVNDITKSTLAYIGHNADVLNAGNTDIIAKSNEQLYNVTVQAVGGAVGLAGAVAVHNFDVLTKAYADSGVDILDADGVAGSITGGKVTVEAEHQVGINSTTVGANISGISIGAAVDVGTVISQTNAYIGDGANVITAGDVEIKASEKDKDFTYKKRDDNGKETNEVETATKMESNAVAGSVGGATVSGSVSVYTFGSGMSAEDSVLLNTNADGNSHVDETGNTVTFDAWLNEQLDKSSTKDAMDKYQGNTIASSVGDALKKRTDDGVLATQVTTISNPTAGAAGTMAKIGKGATIKASNISVNADSNIEMDTNVGSGVAGMIAAGVSVASVSNNSQVSAMVDKGADPTKITADNNFTIKAESLSKLSGFAVAPGAGIWAGAASTVDLNSNTKVTTTIADGAEISGESININAFNTPVFEAYATSAYIGVGAVGAVSALIDSYDDSAVVIGDNVKLNSTGTTNISAENKNYTPDNDYEYNYYAKAEAGSGGVIAEEVIVTHINAYNDTTVTIGKQGTIAANKLNVLAKHDDSVNYEILSAGAAGVSGFGSNFSLTVDSDVDVNIGSGSGNTSVLNADDSDKIKITTMEDTSIKAENNTTKDWLKATNDGDVGEADYNALSAGASLAGGTGIVNETNITHTTDINLDNAVIKANKDASGKNAIVVDAYSNVKSKDYQYIGTGAVIEAAEINDDNNVIANTNVNVGAGVKLYAGSTELANQTPTFAPISQNNAVTIAGGDIAIGARNDADMYSRAYVNTWGGVGVVGATNDVVYDGSANVNFDGYAETANGDVRLAAGRDSAGNGSVINATADTTLINGTVVPISHTANPTAKVDSDTMLTIGTNGNIQSDADVYLQSNAGTINALGTGEIYDWAHAVGEAFGSNSWRNGKSVKETSADVKVDGTVETGIHRNQSITIGGDNVNESGQITNNWYTVVSKTNGISYKFNDVQELQHQLSIRLRELRKLRSEYIADSSTVAIYDREINLIQDQMVALGLAHYSGNTFVEYNASSIERPSNYQSTNLLTSKLYTSAETNELRNKVTALITAYTTLYNASTTSDVDKVKYNNYIVKLNKFNDFLTERLNAVNAFVSVNGNTITTDGKFMVGNTEVKYFTKTESGFTFSSTSEIVSAASNIKNQFIIDDITVTLGDIIVEGDNLYGEGNLLANADAVVNITNSSPHDLVVNDIKIVGKRTTDNQIYEGANVSFNGSYVNNNDDIIKRNLDSAKEVDFAQVKNNKNSTSTVTITNNFDPSAYTVRSLNTTASANADPSEKLFSASNITIANDAKIYNPHGSVQVNSSFGDVYNYGTIDAETVDVNVANGGYTQIVTDGKNIVNIGGDPGEIYDSQHDTDSNNDKSLTSGIYANGDIIIKARYVNINSTIQSGKDRSSLTIPAEYQLYYYSGTTKTSVNIADIQSTWNKNTPIYVEGCDEHLTYDPQSGNFVLDGLDFRGGNIEITGTILNTSSNSEGKIIAFDGYGSINVTNNSGKNLEIRNISTGDGVEGKIKITDLDRETGKIKRVTTYQRINGQLSRVGHIYNYNTIYGKPFLVVDDENINNVNTYTPYRDMYYVWQTGQDSSTVTEYHYTDSDAVIWWKDGNFDDDDLEDMDVVSVTVGDGYNLDNGVLVSGSAQVNSGSSLATSSSDGYYKQYTQTITTSTSDPYDERTETHRVWYTLWILKEYDHWFKIKEGTTTITQNSLAANHPISIGFIGNERNGNLTVTGNSADVILNGMISNVAGSNVENATSISGKNIIQGADGYIKTDKLNLNATENVGVDDAGNIKAIQTNAGELSGSAADGVFAVDVLHGGVNLGNISADSKVELKVVGDIKQNSGTTIDAQRVELTSHTGGIGGADKHINISVDAPAKDANGNVVKNRAYGLNVVANDGIYINNTNGDLYLDSAVSKNGDVVLTTAGSFVDNNFTDIVDKDATTKLAQWAKGQILENEESTANLQKQLLISMAMGKYNRYQALQKNISIDEEGNITFTLSDLDKAALQKSGYSDAQIKEYVTKKLAEYNSLLEQGAETWNPEKLEGYIDAIKTKTVSDNVIANAALQKDALQGHAFAANGVPEFLTADEKAQVLVGSARAQSELLNSGGVGSLKEVTDTNLIIKEVPNVKGNNVTLNAGTKGSIGNKVTTEYSTPVDVEAIKAKGYDHWTDAEKVFMALYSSAERGDVTYDADGMVKAITIVKPIAIDASGTITLSESENIYIVSEEDIIFNNISANNEVRIKANGNINRRVIGDTVSDNQGTITSDGRVILESAQGVINGITLVDDGDSKQELIARAADDITISKAGDLVVDTIFSANGDVTLNVANGSDKNDITVIPSSDNISISANNITLLGVKNLGTEDAFAGLKANGIGGGTIDAAISGEMFVTTKGTINDARLSAINVTHNNMGMINAGTYTGNEDYELLNTGIINDGAYSASDKFTLHNKGKINGGTFNANDIDISADEGSENNNLIIDANDAVTVNADTADVHFKSITANSADVNARNISADVVSVDDTLKLNSRNDVNAQVVRGSNITIEAGNDITVSTQNVVNSLDGIAENAPKDVGELDATAAMITAQGRIDDFNFANGKGNGILESDTGNITLSAGATIAIDTINTKDGAVDIKANVLGIDDLQNSGADTTQITINGSQGDATYYVGIGTSDDNTMRITDSTIENLAVTAIDNVGLSNTIISGDALLKAGKVQMNITQNPHNDYSLYIGDILVSGINIDTTEPLSYVLDGITLNGSHREPTHLSVAEASLYVSEYGGKKAREDESEEANSKEVSITFSEVTSDEEFQTL